MTRINTNLSSLIAQKTLQRSNAQLQESLTRLSTGLRINVGKDDPAGLIASEALRSDIISVRKAITNSERANQLIATADSALGQVSALLNDIRGLVSEAANTGALSDDQIAANQLQIDSSLEAIDRISQITSFQGKRLLDGNLDFITTGVSANIQDLQIDQANFGTLSQIAVGVDVVAQATQGQLTFNSSEIADDVVLQVGGSNGTEAFNFAGGSSIEEIAVAVNLVSDALGVQAEVTQELAAEDQVGEVTISSFGDNNDLKITANAAGRTAGDLNVKFVKGRAGDDSGGNESLSRVAYTAPTATTQGTVTVRLQTQAYTRATDATITNADNADNLTLTADVAGTEFNGVTVEITDVAAGAASATYDHETKTISVALTAAAKTVNGVIGAINTDLGHLFTAGGAGATNDLTVQTLVGTTAGGADGGQIISTAADVRTLLNQTNGAGGIGDDFTVALVDVGGAGTVRDFEEFILTGSLTQNNRLQFLGAEGSRNVRIVASGNNTSLGVDVTSEPPQTGNASIVLGSGTVANGSFKIEAVNEGGLYDKTRVVITDSTTEFVKYDKEQNVLTLSLDLTGATTAQQAIDLINNDTYVSQLFSAEATDGTAAGNLATSIAVALSASTPTLSGGQTDAGTVIINLATDANGNVTTTADDLVEYFANATANTALSALGLSVSNVNGSDGSGLVASGEYEFGTNGLTYTDANAAGTTRARSGDTGRLTVTANTTGSAYDGVSVAFTDSVTAGNETFAYDEVTKTLTIGIQSGTTTVQNILDSFDGYGLEGLFTLTAGGSAATGVVYDTDSGVLSGGVAESGNIEGAAILGNLDEGDATGESTLTFKASAYGSDAFVSIKALSGSFLTTAASGATSERSTGTDVNARINGIQAIGKGLRAVLNTSSLDLSFAVAASTASGSSFNFNITGGGALFQLGPDVVSNQQARLGIQSVSTSTLGGVSGRLFELRSGGDKALATNAGGAAKVVDEVISSVTGLRGRLGAFQKTTLETNIFTLNDTLANLTEAESSIRDADFAAESALLTRAQILVQSGTSVLGIANSNPQNVLSLLR